MSKIATFLRFSRPHTIIGTVLSVTALYLLALSYSQWEDWHLLIWFLTIVSCLGANIFIVGLNQLTDIEIDRINKPYLPLASGEYSIRTGYVLIITGFVISFTIALVLSRFLLLTVLLSLLLGTAYSIAPFRLKRFSFWAAFCIVAVRGVIVNLFLFLHFHSIINQKVEIPTTIWLLTLTIFIYSIVIAWFKDIPDMEGDRRFHIRTLTLRIGAETVLLIGKLLLTAMLLVLLVSPFLLKVRLVPQVMFPAHLIMLVGLWAAGRKVDPHQPALAFRYYQFIWRLFFAEYIAFVLAAIWY